MFDMKSMYNNWINKGSFTFPGTHNDGIDSVERESNEIISMMTANFDDVHMVYNQENDKNLRIAHKLNVMCLTPNSIARTSPRLASPVRRILLRALYLLFQDINFQVFFHESTYNALQYYGFKETPFFR